MSGKRRGARPDDGSRRPADAGDRTGPSGRSQLELALRDPTSVFGAPADVVARADWAKTDRRRVLEQWRLDAEQLETSAWENMGGGEPGRLAEVLAALEQLGDA